MDKTCCICGIEVEETGYCMHENGLTHHLACTLTPEMEEELLKDKENK
jgi:hypothetical protein